MNQRIDGGGGARPTKDQRVVWTRVNNVFNRLTGPVPQLPGVPPGMGGLRMGVGVMRQDIARNGGFNRRQSATARGVVAIDQRPLAIGRNNLRIPPDNLQPQGRDQVFCIARCVVRCVVHCVAHCIVSTRRRGGAKHLALTEEVSIHSKTLIASNGCKYFNKVFFYARIKRKYSI